MKIETKSIENSYFITKEAIAKQGNRIFEDYLKSALRELESAEILKDTEKAKIKVLSDKLEFTLDLLERMAKTPVSESTASTVGDFLLTQAMEMEKIAETLPEGAIKNLFKESAFYIGIEAEKIRQGYYQS